jgi:hypothetical protein
MRGNRGLIVHLSPTLNPRSISFSRLISAFIGGRAPADSAEWLPVSSASGGKSGTDSELPAAILRANGKIEALITPKDTVFDQPFESDAF